MVAGPLMGWLQCAALLQLVVQVLQGVQLPVVVLVKQDLVVEHLARYLVRQGHSICQSRRVRLMAARSQAKAILKVVDVSLGQTIWLNLTAICGSYLLVPPHGRLVLVPVHVPVGALVVDRHHVLIQNVRHAEVRPVELCPVLQRLIELTTLTVDVERGREDLGCSQLLGLRVHRNDALLH